MSTMLDKSHVEEDLHPESRLDSWRKQLSRADLGPAPILIGLVAIWIIFQILNPHFLSARNLTNLILQAASSGTMSIGLVLVLLLGEIDLSVGAVSGLCGSIVAVMNVNLGVSGPLSCLIGILAGAAIGLFQGVWFTRFKIPPFVITLAGWLAWQGAQLWVLGQTGTINLRDPFIVGIANTFFPSIVGWVVGIAAIAVLVFSMLAQRRQRLAVGLSVSSVGALVFRVTVISVAVIGVVALLNSYRGLPMAVVIFIGLIILFDMITRKTTFGRHVYAVGGDIEASRRASINVNVIRIAVMALCSTMAAIGGIMAESYLMAVNQSSGSGDVLLNSIAAAVIGGTSLYGGRGNIWSALIGSLVIFSVSNGMDLLALPSSTKFMVTVGVLLVAVTIDAITSRGRQVKGK